MMTNSKIIYVRPETDVYEVRTNGILCASDQLTGQPLGQMDVEPFNW